MLGAFEGSTGDSGEAERWFRQEAERHSGMIPNTIGERSDAGNSILQEVFGFVKRNMSGAKRRKGWERGGSPCPRLSTQWPGARTALRNG